MGRSPVLSSSDSPASCEYQRSIVASVLDLLDTVQSLVPPNPAQFAWDGAAQRLYVDELARFRGELWQVDALLRQSIYRLGAGHAG